jgi:hypothetical protein
MLAQVGPIGHTGGNRDRGRRIVAAPLPHHRTCGSASGGSEGGGHVCHVPERASPFAAVKGSSRRPAPQASPGRPNGSSSCPDSWGHPPPRLTVASLSLPFGRSPASGGIRRASADFSLPSRRRPFRRKARSPQVRPSTFRARPPDLRRLLSVAGASRSSARSPQKAPSPIRLPFVGPLLSLHASSRHPFAGMPWRFAQVAATSSLRDLHPVADAHAGRTNAKGGPLGPPLLCSCAPSATARPRQPWCPPSCRPTAGPRHR